jgi:hypothetical protein
MNTLNQLQTSSISLSKPKYNLLDVSSASIADNQFKIPSVVVLAAALTAASITFSSPLIQTDSSVSYKRDATYFSSIKVSKDSIVAFSTELYRKSRSITEEESLFIRKMILAKAKKGVTIF